jgi:hypothetical protein
MEYCFVDDLNGFEYKLILRDSANRILKYDMFPYKSKYRALIHSEPLTISFNKIIWQPYHTREIDPIIPV